MSVMIASPEFISLCRTQLRLLSQQIENSSAALYLADIGAGLSVEKVDTIAGGTSTRRPQRAQANFVPVVSYPEPVESWVANFERATSWATHGNHAGHRDRDDSYANSHALALPGTTDAADSVIVSAVSQGGLDSLSFELPADSLNVEPAPSFDEPVAVADTEPSPTGDASSFSWPHILHPEHQLVVPLVYTEVVVGLLVSVIGGSSDASAENRVWQNEERSHVETVAQALAAGCVLERRNQWLQAQLDHKRGLQSHQSEVFHNLLHQFRNPLTAVSTFGQLLVKRLEPEDDNRPVATGIVRESKRLRELVTHFDEAVAVGDADWMAGGTSEGALMPLSASTQMLLPSHRPDDQHKLDSLGHVLTLSAQSLPEIVEPVLAVSRIVGAEKGVHLQAQIAANTPLVWGEAEALGEVVSNLVDNAVKYSPPGAQVWVQTGVSRMGERDDGDNGKGDQHYHEQHYQGIVVGDTGPGIPAADLTRLFERNYRGVQAAGDIPGTGLGLAIARSLVEEMHGSIEVITPAVGTPWVPMPWMPTSETTETSKTTETTDGEQGANFGPGTVFIVWLLEVEQG
ncbi:MAG: GAF domain-containing sensor histidine kinase [Phormidesmis sp. RL_2_1]|nr:GAF domain-containing sensor histidine kinase [Phormidesmis sp. RL_2_1]